MYLVANCLLVAYADNLHLVIRSSSLSTLEKEGNAALKIIEEGAIFNNIQISIDKKLCFTFGRPKNLKHLSFFKTYYRILKNAKCLKI